MNLKEHLLLYTLTPLIVLFIGSAYVRFMVIHDYDLSYEVSCDEHSEDCFIGCEDDDCSSIYYYKMITRYAPDLYKNCDLDVSQCEFAQMCDAGTEKCSVSYCEPGPDTTKDNCEDIIEEITEPKQST